MSLMRNPVSQKLYLYDTRASLQRTWKRDFFEENFSNFHPTQLVTTAFFLFVYTKSFYSHQSTTFQQG